MPIKKINFKCKLGQLEVFTLEYMPVFSKRELWWWNVNPIFRLIASWKSKQFFCWHDLEEKHLSEGEVIICKKCNLEHVTIMAEY